MSDEKQDAPEVKVGASIKIDGIEYGVRPESKDARDRFAAWAEDAALSALDRKFKEKRISRQEYELLRTETFKDIQRGCYAYGSVGFASLAGTHDGIVQSILIRIEMDPSNPKVAPAAVEKWVETVGWKVANDTMQLADGFVPKSPTPADGKL